jgi:DNA-binding NtrC family response regulator
MFFMQKFARQLGKNVTQIPKQAMARLTSYAWPGNIRELQNVIERAVILSPGPTLILEEGGFLGFSSSDENMPQAADKNPASLTDVQRRHIESVLEQTSWVIEGQRGAARLLNVHPNTLRFRMQKLGITRPPQAR